jgi:hypothetical protein
MILAQFLAGNGNVLTKQILKLKLVLLIIAVIIYNFIILLMKSQQ